MFSLKEESRRIKYILFLLVSAFFLIALYAVIKGGNSYLLGSIQKANNDDVRFIRSASVLLKKHMFTCFSPKLHTVFMMPGISIILSFFMLIFGKMGGVAAFRIFQVVIQSLSLFLIFFITKKIFKNSKIALIACFIDALYIPEMYTACLILSEVTFKFLLLLLIYISIFAIETKKARYYIAGGIIMGLECYIRPTIGMFPVIILVFWLIYKYKFKEMVKYTLLVITIFCAILSPWWIRNYIVFHRFIPLTLSTGNPFLQGVYINYSGKKTDPDYEKHKEGKNEIDANENQLKSGKEIFIRTLKKEPVKYIKWYTWGKTYEMWNSPFYWKEVLDVPGMAAEIYHVFVLALGIVGFIFSIRSKNKFALFPALVILYMTLVYLPYYTFSRYAYPVVSCFMCYDALCIYTLSKKIGIHNV